MPKFCANLTMMFTELDFVDRFKAAAKAGFKGAEYLFPYDFDKQELADCLKEHGLQQILFNLPAGDWAAGERGIACLPDRVGEFQDGVGKAIEYAKALGCRQINCLAGIAPEGVSRVDAEQTLISNLAFAATEMKKAGIRQLVEPINSYDIPGFLVNSSRQGLAIIEAAAKSAETDNLFLQYDIYHMQRMEGELASTIAANLPRISHMQLADNPGRHEPGSGEINYGFLFKFIDGLGYDGWIGCEYIPAAGTDAGLGWVKPYLG